MTADPQQLPTAQTRVCITLPPRAQAAAAARRATCEALAAWGLAGLTDTAALLVSELTGNAIRHARGKPAALTLRLTTTTRLLHVEVADSDPSTPTLRSPHGLEEGGYGLVLVKALADEWGVRPTPNGKTVWFQLHTPTPTAANGGNTNPGQNNMNGGTPKPANPSEALGGGDSRRPNVARMFDYYLGGKDNFARDREAAEKVLAAAPEVPLAARENRQFLTRAIHYVMDQAGIRQFIDIGPGLPTRNNVHDIAHRFSDTARVAYVDCDPIVAAHGRALLATHKPQVTMIEGDLREPGNILANPDLQQVIDLDNPLAVSLTLVLHFLPDTDHPYDHVARLLDTLAPGSHLIISHVTGDAKDTNVVQQITGTYDHATAPLVMRSRDTIQRFFAGCTLIPPGVVYLTQWHRHTGPAHALGDGGTRWAYAGVGRK